MTTTWMAIATLRTAVRTRPPVLCLCGTITSKMLSHTDIWVQVSTRLKLECMVVPVDECEADKLKSHCEHKQMSIKSADKRQVVARRNGSLYLGTLMARWSLLYVYNAKYLNCFLSLTFRARLHGHCTCHIAVPLPRLHQPPAEAHMSVHIVTCSVVGI